MRILALTDIHGAYGVMEEIARREEPDGIVIGGDLTTFGTVSEAEGALRAIAPLSALLLCVAGNMDSRRHDELFERLGLSINGSGVRHGDVGFFGVSGAPLSRLHTPYEIPEEEIAVRIRAGYAMVRDAPVKIFVPHAPPYGTRVDIVHAGYHVGSTAVREAVEDLQPAAVICGHIHEGRGVDVIDQSQIVNCGAAAHGYYAMITTGDRLRIELRHLPAFRS